MFVKTRLLAAGLCLAAAACGAHAQLTGTYLPGDIYTPQVAPVLIAPSTNVLGAGSLGGPPYIHPGSLGGANAQDLARAFASADLNHDGTLTQIEAGRIGIGVSSFNDLDRNNDGVLSPGELSDALR